MRASRFSTRANSTGQKDIEFLPLINLPQRIGPVFEIALAGAHAPREKIAAAGWKLVDPLKVTATPQTYRDYIAQSRGEFGVAVNLEVKARSGWFGDRTAAYLASGKPVVVQDTGFSEILPCGEGLFAFRDEAGVCDAVETINKDYQRHCDAARRVAEDVLRRGQGAGRNVARVRIAGGYFFGASSLIKPSSFAA